MLDANDGDIGRAELFALLLEVEIDFARAEQNAPNVGGIDAGLVADDALERARGELVDRGRWQTQEALRRHDDERLAPRP